MVPALRSASIDICLPGMASSVKRAPTSAMRVAPLVMTMKFTMIRIRNTISPITKSPDITRLAKPAITYPAACVPSAPWLRIARVVAMFSERRSIVAISRMVGKEEKSSGRAIHSDTIRISTDSAMEQASPMSIRKDGIGRNRTQRMTTTPSAKNTSRPEPFAGADAVPAGIVPATAMVFRAQASGILRSRLGGKACARWDGPTVILAAWIV